MGSLARVAAVVGITMAAAACVDGPGRSITAPDGSRFNYYELGSYKTTLERNIKAQMTCLYKGGDKQTLDARKKQWDEIKALANTSPDGSNAEVVAQVRALTEALIADIEADIATGKASPFSAVCDGMTVGEAAALLFDMLRLYAGEEGQTAGVCNTGAPCIVSTQDPTTGQGALIIVPNGAYPVPVVFTINFNPDNCPVVPGAFGEVVSDCVDFSVFPNIAADEDVTRAICMYPGEGDEGAEYVVLRYNALLLVWEQLDPADTSEYAEFCDHPPVNEFSSSIGFSRATTPSLYHVATRLAAEVFDLLAPKPLLAVDFPPAGGLGRDFSSHIVVKRGQVTAVSCTDAIGGFRAATPSWDFEAANYPFTSLVSITIRLKAPANVEDWNAEDVTVKARRFPPSGGSGGIKDLGFGTPGDPESVGDGAFDVTFTWPTSPVNPGGRVEFDVSDNAQYGLASATVCPLKTLITPMSVTGTLVGH